MSQNDGKIDVRLRKKACVFGGKEKNSPGHSVQKGKKKEDFQLVQVQKMSHQPRNVYQGGKQKFGTLKKKKFGRLLDRPENRQTDCLRHTR